MYRRINIKHEKMETEKEDSTTDPNEEEKKNEFIKEKKFSV